MASHKRVPNLQVRDARAVSDRHELEALKLFFNTTLPPDEPPSHVFHGSFGKSATSKKASMRKSLFSRRKKRGSLDSDNFGSAEETHRRIPIPFGTVPRKLGGHTVIMIGSRPSHKPISPDLHKSPLIKSASSPVASYKSSLQTSSPVLASSQQTYPRTLPSPQQCIVHLSPPPRTTSQSVGTRDHVPKALAVKNSSALHVQTSSPHSPLSTAMSHTGIISRSSVQTRPPITSVASETEIFFTARNSPVIEPAPVNARLDPVTCDNVTTTSASFVSNREVSHFSVDSEDATPRPPTPIKMTKDACVQANLVTTEDEMRSEQRTAGLSPISSSNLVETSTSPSGALDPPSSHSLQSSGSKKRVKRKRSVPMHHTLSIPYPESHKDYAEILDLEEMEDKDMACTQLAGMYKHQKFLRDAEHNLHQQRIADLTAGIMVQKMVNLKLLEALRERGMTPLEVQALVGTPLETTPMIASSSTDTLILEEDPALDPSRFAMLGKEAQLGRMREFGSSQGNLLSPLVRPPITRAVTEDTLELNNSASELRLFESAQGSVSPISPVPSIPLPPSPFHRRATQSMLLPISRPVLSPSARSRSLTEINFPTSESDASRIDERMTMLEMEFAMSRDTISRATTLSAMASPRILDDMAPYEEFEAEHADGCGNITPFEIIIQEVDVSQELDPLISKASSDDGYHTGLHIMSLGSSWVAGESSSDSFGQSVSFSTDGNEADESQQDPFIDESTHFSQEIEEAIDSSVLTRGRRPRVGRGAVTPNTFYSEPSFTPRPMGLSVDDSTWESVLARLTKSKDGRSRTQSEIDLEKVLLDAGLIEGA